jgi:hypothetical protein
VGDAGSPHFQIDRAVVASPIEGRSLKALCMSK